MTHRGEQRESQAKLHQAVTLQSMVHTFKKLTINSS